MGTADDEGARQVGIVHTDFKCDLPPVAVPADQRLLQSKCLRECHHIICQQAETHAACRISCAAVTAAVWHDYPEMFGEGVDVGLPGLACEDTAVDQEQWFALTVLFVV